MSEVQTNVLRFLSRSQRLVELYVHTYVFKPENTSNPFSEFPVDIVAK